MSRRTWTRRSGVGAKTLLDFTRKTSRSTRSAGRRRRWDGQRFAVSAAQHCRHARRQLRHQRRRDHRPGRPKLRPRHGAVAIQPDGKIVVAGMAVNSGGVGNDAHGQVRPRPLQRQRLARHHLWQRGHRDRPGIANAHSGQRPGLLRQQDRLLRKRQARRRHLQRPRLRLHHLPASTPTARSTAPSATRAPTARAGYVVTGMGGEDTPPARSSNPTARSSSAAHG